MSESTPEQDEPIAWENELLWQARELLVEGMSARFDGFVKIESVLDRMVLRSGRVTEQNMYCFIEDCNAGLLLRSVYTRCTESKEQRVTDMSALIPGGFEQTLMLTEQYVSENYGIRIQQPDHNQDSIVESIRNRGVPMTYDMSRVWADGLGVLLAAQQNNLQPGDRRHVRSIGGFLTRITSKWSK